jgi:exonuclease III
LLVPGCIIAALLLIGGIEPNPGHTDNGHANYCIITQNCRGLTDKKKATNLLRKLQLGSQCKIACLQETHVIDPFVVQNFASGRIVLDNGERNQRGTAIVIPSQFSVTHSKVSGVGRWALAACNHTRSGWKLVIASVYAPNDHHESVVFFQNFFLALDDFCYEAEVDANSQIVVAGDFNFVDCPDYHSVNRVSTNQESNLANIVAAELDDRGLKDTIELLDEDCSCYTWRRGICASKLDYIYTTGGLHSSIKSCRTEWFAHGSQYDHAALSISYDLTANVRGRSYPKIYQTEG